MQMYFKIFTWIIIFSYIKNYALWHIKFIIIMNLQTKIFRLVTRYSGAYL